MKEVGFNKIRLLQQPENYKKKMQRAHLHVLNV